MTSATMEDSRELRMLLESLPEEDRRHAREEYEAEQRAKRARTEAAQQYARLYGEADKAERDRLDLYLKGVFAGFLTDVETDAAILKEQWPYIPEVFDFDELPDPPDWVLRGLLARTTVNILSGDTGSAKSIHLAALARAVLQGGYWLRWEARTGRVLYLDGENPKTTAHGRLRALGLANADRESFRYFRRGGMSFTPGSDSMRGLDAYIEDFRPDLLVIDTVMSLVNVEVNDNDKVTALYRDIRTMAEKHNVCVMLAHHERKPQAGEQRAAAYAMMGARQWAGQADVHITLTPAGEYTETPEDVGVSTEKLFTLKIEKFRDGGSQPKERTTVRGLKVPHPKDPSEYVLTQLAVEHGGTINDEPSAEEILREDIGREMAKSADARKPAEIAKAIGADPKSGTWKRAWPSLKDQELIAVTGKTTSAVAVLTAAGVAWVAGLGEEF